MFTQTVPGMRGRCEPVRARDVARPDRCAEAVGGVVCAGDYLVVVVERQHADDGAEDLLARDRHAVFDAGEHRRV